jgi:hypothetical protein
VMREHAAHRAKPSAGAARQPIWICCRHWRDPFARQRIAKFSSGGTGSRQASK